MKRLLLSGIAENISLSIGMYTIIGITLKHNKALWLQLLKAEHAYGWLSI